MSLPPTLRVTTTSFGYINKQPPHYYSHAMIILSQATQCTVTVFVSLKAGFHEFTGLFFLSFAKCICMSHFFPDLNMMKFPSCCNYGLPLSLSPPFPGSTNPWELRYCVPPPSDPPTAALGWLFLFLNDGFLYSNHALVLTGSTSRGFLGKVRGGFLLPF